MIDLLKCLMDPVKIRKIPISHYDFSYLMDLECEVLFSSKCLSRSVYAGSHTDRLSFAKKSELFTGEECDKVLKELEIIKTELSQ